MMARHFYACPDLLMIECFSMIFDHVLTPPLTALAFCSLLPVLCLCPSLHIHWCPPLLVMSVCLSCLPCSCCLRAAVYSCFAIMGGGTVISCSPCGLPWLIFFCLPFLLIRSSCPVSVCLLVMLLPAPVFIAYLPSPSLLAALALSACCDAHCAAGCAGPNPCLLSAAALPDQWCDLDAHTVLHPPLLLLLLSCFPTSGSWCCPMLPWLIFFCPVPLLVVLMLSVALFCS